MNTIKIQIEEMKGLTCSKYSRKLISQGVDPKEKIEIYRGEMLCLTIKEIGLAAKLDIRENSKSSPFYGNHKPLEEDTLKTLRNRPTP